MRHRLHRILVHVTVVLMTALAVSCGKAAEKTGAAGPSSVWRVEKNGRHIYVGGTIHLLRESDHPMPAVFFQAYVDSAKLVFELPPDSDTDTKVVAMMRQMGSYSAGDDLSAHVSADTLKLVNAWGASNGMPAAALRRLRTWCLALTVAAVEYGKLGADPKHGVDAHFEDLAKKDGKKAEGLETVEFQLNIFAGLSDKLQEELLLQTFTEARTVAADFADLINAWRSGDTVKLHEFLFKDADKYPELMEDFLFKRNRSWVAPLLRYLEKDEKVFVLVGAGHLVGDQGVLALLEKQGCTVTQLGAAEKPGTPKPRSE